MSEDKTPRTRGWVKIALTVSLALNLAAVGLVAGAFLGRDGAREGGRGVPALRSLGLGPFERALSREDRAELRGRIESAGGTLREERRAIGRSLRMVEEALRAPTFDRGAVEEAFERARGLVVSLQETGHEALLDQIESMSLAEREALADSLARTMRRIDRRR